MGAPTYGAAPLAKTFIIVRAFQFMSFVIILGILGSFVAQIVAANYVVAKEIVGTLSVVSTTLLFSAHTFRSGFHPSVADSLGHPHRHQ